FLAHLLDGLVGERADRARLVHRAAEVGIHRDARDEAIASDSSGEQFGRGAHDPRHVAGRVDRRVPLATGERVQPAVAVADELLDLGIEIRVGVAAVEERPLVPAAEGGVGDRPADELRPAEEQELQEMVDRWLALMRGWPRPSRRRRSPQRASVYAGEDE